jgi:molybdopterin molybdotransferase
MISVEEALDKVLSNIQTLETEKKPILETLGQVLAEDVVSAINVPPRDNSALDGYAMQAADTRGASPKNPRVLKVIDIIAAGANPLKKVLAGTAVRIMTGAPTPAGATAVIGFEDTDEPQRKCNSLGYPDEIGILKEEKPEDNIRKAGESIKIGEKVLSKGLQIRPSEIAVLASMGQASIKVIRRPVVAILATGDELTPLGEPLAEGKIYNSNGYGIAAQVLRDGGIPKLLGIALDNERSLTEKIDQAADADLLITIGGVSAGDYDMVKNILQKRGDIVFWKVRTKPGKPIAFGKINKVTSQGTKKAIPHLGLAGNAVSSMVNYELFVRPAILKMMGYTVLQRPTIQAVLEDNIKNEDGRRVFARVVVENREGKYFARLTGP